MTAEAYQEAHHPEAEGTDLAPVVIVGVGRSGTSLLQSMLAAHSQLAFPPETGFLRRLVASGVIARELRGDKHVSRLESVDSDTNVARTGLTSQVLVAQARSKGQVTPRSLYRALLELYARRCGKPHCGDKDPKLVEYLPVVAQIVPQAQIIHIIRDPRDVLVSKKQAAWSKSRPSLLHVFANRVQMRLGRRQGPSLFGDAYHEIVYESLIKEPEIVLRALCNQLDLTFEAQMLRFSESAGELVSEAERSWKEETLGPLLQDNYGKWAGQLEPWEVALTELVCSDAFEAGNYRNTRHIRALGWFGRLGVYLAAAMIVIADPVYRLSIQFKLARARSDA